jgi:hypothetical protein
VSRNERIREDLMDVGVDVDRRRPDVLRIVSSEDPADVDVGEQQAVGGGGEGPRVGRPAPRRVPRVAPLGLVERLDHPRAPVADDREAGVRGPDQHGAVGPHDAAPGLPPDRRERVDLVAVDADDLVALQQHEPPAAVGRQRRDLATDQPGLTVGSDEAVLRSDDPPHGL